MQNKPHFMKRGHLWGEGEKQLKRKNVAQEGIMIFFSYGKYLHVYFKLNINVNILNKQKHTRGNNRVLFFVFFFFYVE